MRVILDTNVLLSALMVRGSPPDVIYRAWIHQRFDLVCCSNILDEIRAVSRRPALRSRLRPAEVGTLVNAVRELADMYEHLPSVDVSTDAGDNFLFGLAQVSKADFIVTGDKSGLLALQCFGATRIVTARQFLELLKQ